MNKSIIPKANPAWIMEKARIKGATSVIKVPQGVKAQI